MQQYQNCLQMCRTLSQLIGPTCRQARAVTPSDTRGQVPSLGSVFEQSMNLAVPLWELPGIVAWTVPYYVLNQHPWGSVVPSVSYQALLF